MKTPLDAVVQGALEAGLAGASEGTAAAVVFTPETQERWTAGHLTAGRAVVRSRAMLRLLEDERESFVVVRQGSGLAVYPTGSFFGKAVNVRNPLKRPTHFHDLGVPAFVPRPGRLRPSGLSGLSAVPA